MDRGVVVEVQYDDGPAIRLANREGWLIAAGEQPDQGWRVLVQVMATTNMPPYTHSPILLRKEPDQIIERS